MRLGAEAKARTTGLEEPRCPKDRSFRHRDVEYYCSAHEDRAKKAAMADVSRLAVKKAAMADVSWIAVVKAAVRTAPAEIMAA